MTTCTRNCDSQCDDCHTLNNCVPSVTRVGDLLLCASCAANALISWLKGESS